MGLDDFVTDDNDSSTNNSSSNTSSKSTPTDTQLKDNSPSIATQLFSDNPSVHPRGIKYHIKSFGYNWTKTFSRMRFEGGEMVMVGQEQPKPDNDERVVVFTTIQSSVDDVETDETQDIWVTIWDMSGDGNPIEEDYVSSDGNWKDKLCEAVEEMMFELGSRNRS